MRKLLKHSLLFALIFSLTILPSIEANADSQQPTPTILQFSHAPYTSFSSVGEIVTIQNIAAHLTLNGFVYSKTEDPTSTSAITVTLSPTEFTYTIVGLEPGTTYYVWPFATSLGKTIYGAQLQFTSRMFPPLVDTLQSSYASPNSDGTYDIYSYGKVTEQNVSAITSCGVEWREENGSENTSIKEGEMTQSSTTFATLLHLKQGTTYLVRAYATNSAGTGYGEYIRILFAEI